MHHHKSGCGSVRRESECSWDVNLPTTRCEPSRAPEINSVRLAAIPKLNADDAAEFFYGHVRIRVVWMQSRTLSTRDLMKM